MTSVQQFCAERNAFIMFLNDGAIGLKLYPDILLYLNRIRKIAIKNNLVLITGNINHNKLYEMKLHHIIIVIHIYIGITIMIC